MFRGHAIGQGNSFVDILRHHSEALAHRLTCNGRSGQHRQLLLQLHVHTLHHSLACGNQNGPRVYIMLRLCQQIGGHHVWLCGVVCND